jgi:serine/threonine-protein kinase RsbT
LEILREESFELRGEDDVGRARQVVRSWSMTAGFGLVDQTKIVTVASELARNTVLHGGGGLMRLRYVANGRRKGLQLDFEDQGPGIPDIERAMRDGFTTKGGLGLGLGGSKRLMSEFHVESAAGKGTRVSVGRWL